LMMHLIQLIVLMCCLSLYCNSKLNFHTQCATFNLSIILDAGNLLVFKSDWGLLFVLVLVGIEAAMYLPVNDA